MVDIMGGRVHSYYKEVVMAQSAAQDKKSRKFIRYLPDPLDYGLISFHVHSDYKKNFEPDIVALIIEESSRSGCSLIFHKRRKIGIGAEVVLQLGRMAPIRAEVVWINELEEVLYRAGFKFLE